MPNRDYISTIKSDEPFPIGKAGHFLYVIDADTGVPVKYEWTGEGWSDIWTADSRNSARALNIIGQLYLSDSIQFTLATDASYTVAIDVSDARIAVEEMVSVSDSSDTLLQVFEGGVVTGGTPVNVANTNFDSDNTFSITVLLSGATVSTPGALQFSRTYLGSDGVGNASVMTGGKVPSQVIMSANTLVYVTFTNNGAEADYNIGFMFGDNY